MSTPNNDLKFYEFILMNFFYIKFTFIIQKSLSRIFLFFIKFSYTKKYFSYIKKWISYIKKSDPMKKN